MIKVSTTGMVVSSKTDLRFPITGQWEHGAQIIHHTAADMSELIVLKNVFQVFFILLFHFFRPDDPHPGSDSCKPAKEL